MFHLKSTIVNLERNHVVFVAILFSCQGTDVRERAAILPDPHVRVKRLSSTSRGANPSDADTLTARICCWKRSAGPNYLAACRDRGVYVPVAPLSTTSFDSRRGAVDCFRAADHGQPVHPHRYSSSFCCTTCCADSS
jgi:hypothetical protein